MRHDTHLENRYQDCPMVESLGLDPIGRSRQERQNGVVGTVNCGQECPYLDTALNTRNGAAASRDPLGQLDSRFR